MQPYLTENNKLVIVTTNAAQLDKNLSKLFREEPEMLARYSIEKILLIQEELLNQAETLEGNKVLTITNTADLSSPVNKILNFLSSTKVIEPIT